MRHIVTNQYNSGRICEGPGGDDGVEVKNRVKNVCLYNAPMVLRAKISMERPTKYLNLQQPSPYISNSHRCRRCEPKLQKQLCRNGM